jgi:hypothetical protein
VERAILAHGGRRRWQEIEGIRLPFRSASGTTPRRTAHAWDRGINIGAYTNSEELIGSPQNPRRITIGFDLRLK